MQAELEETASFYLGHAKLKSKVRKTVVSVSTAEDRMSCRCTVE